MRKLVVSRLALAVPQLVIVAFVVFSMTYLVPGSPAAAILGASATPESIRQVEAQLGLDRPAFERLIDWAWNALNGDLGVSFVTTLPVTDMLLQRMPATLSLTVGGMVVALALGIGLGVLSAVRAGLPDRVIGAATSVGLSIPEFWFGMILLLVFAVELGWVPVVAYVPLTDDPLAWLRGMILPSIALGIGAAALIARQTRGAMVEALASPYVDTLTAAGVSRRRIVLRYALKNAMVPVLATTGLTFRILIGTSFVVEQIFAFPGAGRLLLTSVIGKDFPVVQGGVIVIAALVIALNLLIDVSYGLLNPKVRPQ
ncbi:ABC transporter permease [Planomonospora venezuelensis]|uniref:Peptide/nickel transport system permease protein n=1 Tax=Planomonospora venezuelensis TaxID=1999 RepID=A0A841DH07_PLAVE|nr:ABC transporter permease [Planomonospora venezuelensis]MBB5967385.1 peptide/nickel transport system permease protein [Planomonospora venezuelensis]GIN05303.1 ABC transporter permease [Planomonospora venezuelensis]